MMPTIRVDDDVFEELRNRGKTGDSFSNVLRPLLGLALKKRRTTGRAAQMEKIPEHLREKLGLMSSDTAERLEELLSKHLPEHWNNAPMRRDHILSVVYEFLTKEPTSASITDRHLWATKRVADRDHVEVTTVLDKCGRQLYGVGESGQMEQFRAALARIEIEWRGWQGGTS